MPAEFSKQLLSDHVYDLIRASILDGSRAPGSRVVESEIARSFSISQAPVRDAVRRLVHAGLLTSEPRRGSHVTELSQEDFGIARQLRAALESIGARAAVEHLTLRDLTELREIVTLMGQAVAGGGSAEFRSLDMRFHHRVMTIADGAVLGRVWDTLAAANQPACDQRPGLRGGPLEAGPVARRPDRRPGERRSGDRERGVLRARLRCAAVMRRRGIALTAVGAAASIAPSAIDSRFMIPVEEDS